MAAATNDEHATCFKKFTPVVDRIDAFLGVSPPSVSVFGLFACSALDFPRFLSVAFVFVLLAEDLGLDTARLNIESARINIATCLTRSRIDSYYIIRHLSLLCSFFREASFTSFSLVFFMRCSVRPQKLRLLFIE